VDRLDSLGCLRANTVLVHGVAMTTSVWRRVVDRGAGLVWCPQSNHFLFGRTLPVREWLDESDRSRHHVCLGTDSRVTGARDLLDELRAARSLSSVTPRELLRMVTTTPARILRLPESGYLARGNHADLMVIPATKGDRAESLLDAERRHVLLVMVGGRPMVGAPALADVFRARRTPAHSVTIDGEPRLMDARLARAVRRCPIREPGVECR
jgi:cytosine/adenosine deaminase-related metal-dependent hydrolase